MPTKPLFVDTVTHIPAYWANNVTDLIFDVFELANTKAGVRAALELGTMSVQDAANVAITGGSINNTPIGMAVPVQGRFSVLSAETDPIAPTHVVNKRYLAQQLSVFNGAFLPTIGGEMYGPIKLNGDPVGPLDAVPRRWVDARLIEAINHQPIQRWTTDSAGQSAFVWTTFDPTIVVHHSNFMVYLDGQFQSLNVNYAVDLSGPFPQFVFTDTIAAGRTFDVVYLNNLDNLLLVAPPPVTPPPGVVAGPGWSNPINMRVNYALANAGENQIASSHTVLREMFIGCILTSGDLQDRVVSWQSSWTPDNASGTLNPPQIVTVSSTEAKLVLPENPTDHYYAGRLEINMLLDGIPTGQTLWMDMTNQVTPDYRDGRVRWGFISTIPTLPRPVITTIIDDRTEAV